MAIIIGKNLKQLKIKNPSPSWIFFLKKTYHKLKKNFVHNNIYKKTIFYSWATLDILFACERR